MGSFSYLSAYKITRRNFSTLDISADSIIETTLLKFVYFDESAEFETISCSISDNLYNWRASVNLRNSSRTLKCFVVFRSPFLNSGKFSITRYISSIDLNWACDFLFVKNFCTIS